ncbi:MAG TPA: MFS transporter [Stenomitos sp.]
MTSDRPGSTAQPCAFWGFMAGSLVSRVGDWMDMVALNWATMQHTHSALALALINACRVAPVFLMSLPAGILADRHDRRRLLIGVQAGTMALTVAIGFLVKAHGAVWGLALLVIVRSCLAAMDGPVREALLPSLVPSGYVARAVALNQAQFHLARAIGPMLAGLLLSVAPLETAFWISAVTSLAILAALLPLKPSLPLRHPTRAPGGIREAVRFVRDRPSVQVVLLLAIAPMVFGFPYTSMMALFAHDLQHLGPAGLGGLMAASALGAFVGSAGLGYGSDRMPGRMSMVASVAGFGIALMFFACSRNWNAAACALLLAGFAGHRNRTQCRIALQLEVPDELRGRVMALALMDRGFIPLGAMLIGAIAQGAGAWWGAMAMGGGCVATALVALAARPRALKVRKDALQASD